MGRYRDGWGFMGMGRDGERWERWERREGGERG